MARSTSNFIEIRSDLTSAKDRKNLPAKSFGGKIGSKNIDLKRSLSAARVGVLHQTLTLLMAQLWRTLVKEPIVEGQQWVYDSEQMVLHHLVGLSI